MAGSSDSDGHHPNQSSTNRRPVVIDKTLSSAANLAQLHPTGTVLAFQALSPSFSNHGMCCTSNKCITLALIFLCSIACIVFSFTDSLVGTDKKLYFGIATPTSFYPFNFDGSEEERKKVLADARLERLKIRRLDCVHAFFSVVVFLTITFSDTKIQNCFFPNAGPNSQQILENLPLGAGLVSSAVFAIFPTARKGIGYSEAGSRSDDQDASDSERENK